MNYTIYSKSGTPKLNAANELVKPSSLECTHEWMGDSALVCKVSSAFPILWAVGDYIDYQGDRYIITGTQGFDKQSHPGSTRDAFVYDVRFDGYTRELDACEMRDVVPSTDHNTHYTSMRDWSLFCPDVRTFAERISANLNRLYTGSSAWSVTVSPNAPVDGATNLIVQVSDETVKEALDHIKADFGLAYTIRGRRIVIWTRRDAATSGLTLPNDFLYGKGNGLFKITQSVDKEHRLVTLLRAYGSTRNLPLRYYNTGTTLPDNLNVRNLMLPSFGRAGLDSIISSVYSDSRYSTAKSRLTDLGFDTEAKLRARFEFSTNAADAWIKSKHAADFGLIEGSVTFDGNEEGYDDIYPSIQYVGDNADKVVSADTITDNGIFGEGVEIPDFYIVINPGFDPSEHIPFGASSFTVSMIDGYCGGREFECVSVTKFGDAYKLRLHRQYDDALGLYFPYTQNSSGAYNIKSGDRFVLLGIDMPSEYVERTAINALLPSAIGWLSEHDTTRCKYQLSVDEVQMQRWCDEQSAEGQPTLHDTLRAGLMLSLADFDIQIGGAVAIDKIVIRELDDALPKYDITLSEEKQWSSLKRLNNKLKYTSLEAEPGEDGRPGKDGKDAASYRLIPSASVVRAVTVTRPSIGGRAGIDIGGGGSLVQDTVDVTLQPDVLTIRRVKIVDFEETDTDFGSLFVSVAADDDGNRVWDLYAGQTRLQPVYNKVHFCWKATTATTWDDAKDAPTIAELTVPIYAFANHISEAAEKVLVDRGQLNLSESYIVSSGDDYDENDVKALIVAGKRYNVGKARERLTEEQIDQIWEENYDPTPINPDDSGVTQGGQGTAEESPDRPTLNT